MPPDVKQKRSYTSARRDAQARRTRREILDAARRLFIDQGYAATTVDALAAEAGVAVQTVYAAVGNKREVLWDVLEAEVAGDDEPRTVLERFGDQVTGVDQSQRLAQAIAFGRRIVERSADLYRIMRSAAESDAAVADAFAEVEQRRRRDIVGMMQIVAGDDGYATDADEQTAVDLVHALTSYDVYAELVGERGWSAEKYERWITRALEPLLAETD